MDSVLEKLDRIESLLKGMSSTTKRTFEDLRPALDALDISELEKVADHVATLARAAQQSARLEDYQTTDGFIIRVFNPQAVALSAGFNVYSKKPDGFDSVYKIPLGGNHLYLVRKRGDADAFHIVGPGEGNDFSAALDRFFAERDEQARKRGRW